MKIWEIKIWKSRGFDYFVAFSTYIALIPKAIRHLVGVWVWTTYSQRLRML